MTCENCDPVLNYSGRIIKTSPDHKFCAVCGWPINKSLVRMTDEIIKSLYTWDNYFRSICVAVASKSPCLSRKIGAILVKDHSIVSTGFNGPSRGIPHCGHDRFIRDVLLANEARRFHNTHLEPVPHPNQWMSECPRKLLKFESGTGMQWCPAQHAEENAVSNAARLGVSVLGSTLYMNCITPCKNCFGTLINAGIIEIVVDDIELYDEHTQFLVDNSNIKIRQFCL